jgi:BMFP domain-containing protein YqiC
MKPDLDAIRARLLHPNLTAEEFESIMAILACIEERESPTTYTVGETEWAHRIATLEHMLAEERENVDTLRARVAELEARANRATYTVGETEWAHRIAVAEQRFVDESDARKAAGREIAELKARIVTLEAMR